MKAYSYILAQITDWYGRKIKIDKENQNYSSKKILILYYPLSKIETIIFTLKS